MTASRQTGAVRHCHGALPRRGRRRSITPAAGVCPDRRPPLARCPFPMRRRVWLLSAPDPVIRFTDLTAGSTGGLLLKPSDGRCGRSSSVGSPDDRRTSPCRRAFAGTPTGASCRYGCRILRPKPGGRYARILAQAVIAITVVHARQPIVRHFPFGGAELPARGMPRTRLSLNNLRDHDTARGADPAAPGTGSDAAARSSPKALVPIPLCTSLRLAADPGCRILAQSLL
jgi:hypothetical protein